MHDRRFNRVLDNGSGTGLLRGSPAGQMEFRCMILIAVWMADHKMTWKHFWQDQVRDSFGLSAERDAINDITEGHPLWHDAVVGIHKRDFESYHNALEPKGKRQKMSRTRRHGDHNMQESGGPSKVSLTHRRSKYHNVLGRKPKKACQRSFNRDTLFDASDTTLTDKTLHKYRLMELPYSDTDFSLDTRSGHNCYVKGMKLRWVLKLKNDTSSVEGGAGLTEPLTIRWAILCPETNTGATSDISTSEFFRDPESSNDMYINFTEGSALYTDLMCRQINTDKYGIVKTGTFTMGTSVSGTDSTKHWNQQKIMNMWVPVNKIITWENVSNGTDDEYPEANLYFCWWYCKRADLTAGRSFTGSAGALPFEMMIEKTLYYKNLFR